MDWKTRIEKFDLGNMQGILAAFPAQVTEGYARGKKLELPKHNDFQNVLISGMGGSGFNGDLVQQAFSSLVAIPITVNKGYALPAFVGKNTLVICVSFSGNTEETLAVHEKARKTGAACIGICSGGALAKRNPAIMVPGGIQPRLATGYLLFALLGAFECAGILPETEIRAAERKKFVEKNIPFIRKRAELLAEQLANRFPVVYAVEEIGCAAYRWQTGFNENAKTLVHSNVIPEMNHNEINARSVPANTSIVLLRSPAEHEQQKKRCSFSKTAFSESGIPCHEEFVQGKDTLDRLLYAILLGDWVSFYYAIGAQQNPTIIPLIDRLKAALMQPLAASKGHE